ncbi:MAG TPA: CoA-binding protein [Candidatus Thermoplasmatota archaeon]|nr:CoA-binding protein [Candidatus Thermoplasmatota archaeon]
MDDPIDLLRWSKRIAVVGCSATPGKDAHDIPRRAGSPARRRTPSPARGGELFGRTVYRSLAEVPGPIDIVNVFRPAEEAPAIAREAAAAGAKALWLQSGLESAEAERIARAAGLRYVENACLSIVARHVRLLDGPVE